MSESEMQQQAGGSYIDADGVLSHADDCRGQSGPCDCEVRATRSSGIPSGPDPVPDKLTDEERREMAQAFLRMPDGLKPQVYFFAGVDALLAARGSVTLPNERERWLEAALREVNELAGLQGKAANWAEHRARGAIWDLSRRVIRETEAPALVAAPSRPEGDEEAVERVAKALERLIDAADYFQDRQSDVINQRVVRDYPEAEAAYLAAKGKATAAIAAFRGPEGGDKQ